MMWAGYGFSWIWMVLFWVAVVGLIAWAIARLTPLEPGRQSSGTARTILDERYARGELDEDEYRRRRGELGT